MRGIVATALITVSFTAFAKARFVPGEVIVKMKKKANLGTALARTGLRQHRVSKDFVVIRGVDTETMVANLTGMDEVEYAEPNYIVHAIMGKRRHRPSPVEVILSQISDDPKSSLLWGLKNFGNNEPDANGNASGDSTVEGADAGVVRAWDVTQGSRDVVIAVIDTGVDYNHPDLVNNMWVNEAEKNGDPGVDDDGNGFVDDIHGYDFAGNDADPMDVNGHGTHCAGTIGASIDNKIGIAGVMGNVQIMALKFLGDGGSGTTEDAIRAIDYATDQGVHIMSNSWGGGGESKALKEAIERAAKKNILFVAAAGNSSSNNDLEEHYPSNYKIPNVISVGSHTAQDQLSDFSSYGRRSVHVLAPGSNILSTTPGNKYDVYSGTSMATPHVSGILGLYISENGRPQDLDYIRKRLIETSVGKDPYRGKAISHGRVNAYNFLMDERTPQRGPKPHEWVDVADANWESAHPYPNNFTDSVTFNAPGAKYMRVILDRFELESTFDFVHVTDSQGRVVESVTGNGRGYDTMYVDGESITLTLKTDFSVGRWGVRAGKVQAVFPESTVATR